MPRGDISLNLSQTGAGSFEAKKNRNIFIRFLIFLSLVCLWSSVTNIIPLSASLAVLVLLVPLFLFQDRTHHVIFFSLAGLLLYFGLSTIIYAPESIFQYSFYRRDGNVFIAYAPLLVLSLFKIKLDLESVVRRFIYFASFLNGFFLIIFFITGGTIFFYEPGIYHFLFEAHNAAGGFLSMISAFSVAYYFGTKERIFLILTAVNLIGLYATDSRGSILALIAACLILPFLRRKAIFAGFIVLLFVSQTLIMVWLYNHSEPADFLKGESTYVKGINLSHIGRGETIIMRGFYLWPRAMYLFLHSPILGTGFGSYNDTPYVLEGIDHVFQFNNSKNIAFGDNHAHHTFLHVLAETGLVGFFLLLYFLAKVRKFILTLSPPPVQYALHIAFWVAVISSVTEHRLFTPSQMFPFTITLGLSLAVSRQRMVDNAYSLGERDLQQDEI